MRRVPLILTLGFLLLYRQVPAQESSSGCFWHRDYFDSATFAKPSDVSRYAGKVLRHETPAGLSGR